jgi:hypothetical protein
MRAQYTGARVVPGSNRVVAQAVLMLMAFIEQGSLNVFGGYLHGPPNPNAPVDRVKLNAFLDELEKQIARIRAM